jgi:hypothetical protein
MMTDTEKERSLRVCGFSHLRPGPREHIKRTYGHTTQGAFNGRVWTREKVTRIELSCGHEFIGSDMVVEVGEYFDCEKCRPGPVKTRLQCLEHIGQLATELCVAADRQAEDIGGSRRLSDILRDLGPLTDELEKLK